MPHVPAMPTSIWRTFLAVCGGALLMTSLSGLRLHLPGGGRAMETVAVFIFFLAACLLLEKLMTTFAHHRHGLSPEQREARRLGQLRIGIPEGLSHLEALRRSSLLEKRLQNLGLSVSWHEYSSASSLLHALHAGVIDFCGGGGTPSIFAQAADLLFVRVARDKYTTPGGDAILVPHHSRLRNLDDLRGCRVAVEEGSTAHYVLIRALMHARIALEDIEIVFLARREAQALFASGAIDAWSVWVPYADAPHRRHDPGRPLISLRDLFGTDPTLQLPTLYYCTPELSKSFPTILKIVLEEVNEAGAQINRDNLAVVVRLAEQFTINEEWILRLRQLASERSIVPLGHRAIAGLQQQADLLRELHLIPKRIRVADGTYSLILRQNWTI